MAIPVWIQQAIHMYGYLLVFMAVGLESLGVPFPGETTLLAAAVYAGTGGPLNLVLVIIAAAAGAIMGDNLGYLAGYYGGYSLIQRILRLLHLNEVHWQTAQRYFEQHGNKTVFFGRFVTLLRLWTAFLAGASRMRWQTFLFWNALGGIVWASIYGTLGFVLGHNLPLLGRVLRAMGVGGTIVLILVIVGGLGFWLLRRRHDQRPTTTSSGWVPPLPMRRPTSRTVRLVLIGGALVALLDALLAAQVAGIGGA
jgi:membrane protein DedA with SNARE-associated domain